MRYCGCVSNDTDEGSDSNKRVELTREKVLAGLGTIGAVGAGAGVGTSALFSDNEQFNNNELTAGTLNLTVSATVVEASEYFTSNSSGPNIVGDLGTADGAVVSGLQVGDIKPGDWAILCFEVSVEGNPGYVQVSSDNFVQYENGQTESEADFNDSAGGSLGLPLDGQEQGELQDELLVQVYGKYDPENGSDPPQSYLKGKRDSLSGTATEVFNRLDDGAFLGDGSTPGEIGPENSPVKLYFLLELPTNVGNAVQSDALAFDLIFESEQARHNQIATAMRSIADAEINQGEETTVTLTIELDGVSDVDVFERFDTKLGAASFEGATVDGESISPSFVDLDEGGGIVLFDGVGSGTLSVEYSLSISEEATDDTYSLEPNLVDVDEKAVPVDGVTTIKVVS